MEIITGVERLRRWRREEKLRIVAEVEQPGASFAAVARRHEVSRGLLWNWRAQVRSGVLAPGPVPVFMPVRIMSDLPPLGHPAPALPGAGPSLGPVAPAPGLIEIELGDGRQVRVGADVNQAALRRVLAAGTTDMRRGMNGLALQVQQVLGRDPHGGDLYIFRGRKADLVKVLWHDDTGMSLYVKRLEQGRFVWPQAREGVVSLTPATLSMLLEGIDWRTPQRSWRPEMAG